jgi:Na+/H+ antiporter NhaC
MKQMISLRLKGFFVLAMVFLFSSIASAQDSTVTTTQTSRTATETTWHIEPWMWIVGAVVVLLILIGLFRGKSTTVSSDRVTVTKTVERDTDV